MSDQTQPLPGSYREAPGDMRAAGRVAADEQITVSLYLKPAGEAPVLSDRASMLAARSTEHGDDLAAVSDFASSNGLTIAGSDQRGDWSASPVLQAPWKRRSAPN